MAEGAAGGARCAAGAGGCTLAPGPHGCIFAAPFAAGRTSRHLAHTPPVSPLQDGDGQLQELQALAALRSELDALNSQEQEAAKLHARISAKVSALREKAELLQGLQAEKKQLEEQVAALKGSADSVALLQQQQEGLQATAAESERLAALNSEMRLLGMGADALRQEHVRLVPLAAEAAVLKESVAEMEAAASTLGHLQVCSRRGRGDGCACVILQAAQQLQLCCCADPHSCLLLLRPAGPPRRPFAASHPAGEPAAGKHRAGGQGGTGADAEERGHAHPEAL